jgi:hypothetical protein
MAQSGVRQPNIPNTTGNPLDGEEEIILLQNKKSHSIE